LLEADKNLLIYVAYVPDGETLDKPGTHISFAVDPANLAIAIQICDNDTRVVHPIGRADSMTIWLALNIIDERSWSRVQEP
jgi:hypothetical protein